MAHHTKKQAKPKLSTKEKLISIKKAKKEKLKEKRAKLVVRNLPFEATEEKLRQYFEMFGEIDNIHLLKKEDGKSKGCAFVQYKHVQMAKKAQHHTNGQSFMGREITVNFALAKDKYEEVKIKQENGIKLKEEPATDLKDVEVKTEETETEKEEEKDEEIGDKDEKQDESDEDMKQEEEHENMEEEEEENDESAAEEDDKNDEDMEDEEEKEGENGKDDGNEEENAAKKPRFESQDVNEGRTVFINNVPFTATNEELKECMQQFGPVVYALICFDPVTEHSRGNAFVKFQEKEDAEKAMAAGTELTLQGQVLSCRKALTREELRQKRFEKEQRFKDKRNLYLAKEGLILAGSPAAKGVSPYDMNKRVALEQSKWRGLKNLHNFISREGLTIHNIPLTYDDSQFFGLIKKNSPAGAQIKYARVIKNFQHLNEQGEPMTKGYGFVTFTKHEDALATLRALNNNPDVFTPDRRPIVFFSVNNKLKIAQRKRRDYWCTVKNPNSSLYDPNVANRHKEEDSEGNGFMGLAAKPGAIPKARNRYNLKTQTMVHMKNVRRDKMQMKSAKIHKQFTKQPKQKINYKKESDNMTKLENKFKAESTSPGWKATKWYNESE